MADDTTNQPAGVQAGQPAGGGTTQAVESEQQGEDRTALRARAIAAERKLAQREAAAQAAEEKRMAEAGEHKDIATRRAAEADAFKAKYVNERKRNALIVAGMKVGIEDLDFLALASPIPDDINVDDTDALRIAAENAVAPVKVKLSTLLGKKNGSSFPTPNANPGSTRTFDPSKVTAADIKSMSPEEFKAYRAAKYGGTGTKDIFGR